MSAKTATMQQKRYARCLYVALTQNMAASLSVRKDGGHPVRTYRRQPKGIVTPENLLREQSVEEKRRQRHDQHE
ncbi:MAG: hypothetical protein QF755_03670 [Candidatus Peribacteraceae bacterium]|nr:hypothetical protein [Candidatus Peribacteraceae bacterium]